MRTFDEAITYVVANERALIQALRLDDEKHLENEKYLQLLTTLARAITASPDDPEEKAITLISTLSAAVETGIAIGRAQEKVIL